MKVNAQWNIGRQGVGFGVTAEATVEAVAEQQALACLGLKYLMQRVGEVDKVLGGFTTDKTKAVDGAKGDGPWRVKGFKRGDVPYSEAMASKLASLFTELDFPDSTKDTPHVLKGVTVVVGMAEGESKEPAFKREKAKFAEKESTEEGLEAWLKRFAGYTGPTHGDDGEYAVEALQAAKVAIDKFLKENI